MSSENPYQTPAPAPSAARPPSKPWLMYAGMMIGTGLLIVFAGVIYGAVIVGVPSPDAPAVVLEREAFHIAISTGIALVGVVALLLGLAAAACIVVYRTVALVLGKS